MQKKLPVSRAAAGAGAVRVEGKVLLALHARISLKSSESDYELML